MKLKIDFRNLPSSFILFLLIVSFFYPSSQSTNVISMIRYISMALSVIIIVIARDYLKSWQIPITWGLIPIVYYIYLYVVSSINGTSFYNNLALRAILQFFIILGLFFHQFKRNESQTYNALFFAFLFFAIWDYIDIIFHPTGSSSIGMWIMGNKNNHSLYYFIIIYLSVIKYRINQNIINALSILIITIMNTAVTFILNSSTSIVTILIIDLGIAAFFLYKGEFKIKCKIALIGFFILNIIVTLGHTSFLTNVVSLFNKDLTFSDRTTVWDRTLLMISQKPFTGWGLIHGTEAKTILGYSNAHNQLLDCMLCGGIILLTIFIISLFLIANRMDRAYERKFGIFNELFFCGLLVKMVFEQVAVDYMFWILFILILSFMQIETRGKEIDGNK